MRVLPPSLVFVFVLAALALPSPAAQAQDAAACDAPEARQLDFWLGRWTLTWPGGQGGTPEGEQGRGTNTIRQALDGCVVEEDFRSETGYRGRSVSVYHRRTQQWRQTWVDNRGGYLPLAGGSADGTMTLYTEPFVNPGGQRQVNRMIWTDVTDDALVWRWQRSTDGGATWEDQWVIRYARAR